MERVTLERFYRDPELVSRICAQARRERAEMVRRFLGALFARPLKHRARRAVAAAAPAACH